MKNWKNIIRIIVALCAFVVGFGLGVAFVNGTVPMIVENNAGLEPVAVPQVYWLDKANNLGDSSYGLALLSCTIGEGNHWKNYIKVNDWLNEMSTVNNERIFGAGSEVFYGNIGSHVKLVEEEEVFYLTGGTPGKMWVVECYGILHEDIANHI